MQDRFKFRLYDKAIGEMAYDVCVGFIKDYGKTDDWVCADTSCGQITYRGNKVKDIVLMQCTGLKDKNGKLIYEADIVKYKDEVYGLCIGRIEKDNAHYELLYYTGEKYGWFSHILCFKHIKNMEVIGNIYENPELLERNNDKTTG